MLSNVTETPGAISSTTIVLLSLHISLTFPALSVAVKLTLPLNCASILNTAFALLPFIVTPSSPTAATTSLAPVFISLASSSTSYEYVKFLTPDVISSASSVTVTGAL